MPFEEGHQKFGGREKGTPNRITKELRKVLKNIVAKELDNLPTYLESLTEERRVEILFKLMPYVFPKLNNISAHSGEPIEINITEY